MKNQTLFRSLLVASLAILSACGGDDQPVVNPNNCLNGRCDVNKPRIPNNGNVNQDFLYSYMDTLQQQYGNIIIDRRIEFIGRAIPAGTYSWRKFYQNYIYASITGSDCRINHQQTQQNILSPWGTLNYNCYQSKAYQYYDLWQVSKVYFEYTRYQNSYTSFYSLFEWFFSTGYSYTNNFYYPTVMGGGSYNDWTGYWGYNNCGYDPYWYGQVQYYDPYFYGGQNDGWYLNINVGMLFGG